MAQGSLTFESKQSDYWLIEDTDELVLCSAISSVSATGNEVITSGICDDTVAIYPVIHKINRKTNKKTLLYPSSLTTQVTATSSAGYVFETAPEPAYRVDVRIVEISKPIISQNKYNGLFNVTFQGKYSDDKLAIFTYLFQYVDTSMHLVDSFLFIPEEKFNNNYKHTFENGYINPNFIIKGIENFNEDFTVILDNPSYNSKPTNYKMRPFHYKNNIRFGSSLQAYINTSTTPNSYYTLPNNISPIAFTGGFIAQRTGRKSLPFKISTKNKKTDIEDKCLRIDFTHRTYALSGSGANLSRQSYYELFHSSDDTTQQGVRGVALKTMTDSVSSAVGSGFCVFLYIPGTEIVTKDTTPDLNAATFTGIYPQNDASGTSVVEDPDFKELSLQGVGSSLGYVPAETNIAEVNGVNFATKGIRASGFLAIAFDIEGEFGTTSNGKPGAATNANIGTANANTDITIATPYSVTVRGGKDNDYKVLHRTDSFASTSYTNNNNSQPVSAFFLQQSVSEATATATSNSDVNYVDVRIDFYGNKLTVSSKLTSDSTFYKLIDNLDISQFYTNIPSAVKVGLSFSNSSKVANFDLKEFKVTGSTTKEFNYESDVNIQTDAVDKLNFFNPDTTIAAQGQGTVISSPDQSTTIFRCQS